MGRLSIIETNRATGAHATFSARRLGAPRTSAPSELSGSRLPERPGHSGFDLIS
jgi:hypothetical protein